MVKVNDGKLVKVTHSQTKVSIIAQAFGNQNVILKIFQNGLLFNYTHVFAKLLVVIIQKFEFNSTHLLLIIPSTPIILTSNAKSTFIKISGVNYFCVLGQEIYLVK